MALLEELSGSMISKYDKDTKAISFSHLKRDLDSKQKSDSQQNSVSTFWEEKTLKRSSLHSSPRPRADAIVVYIPEEKFYVLYGGYIPAKYTPRGKYSEPLNDIWKYHFNEDRWKLELPEREGRWNYLYYRSSTLKTFHHFNRIKIYLLEKGYHPQLFELDYHRGGIQKLRILDDLKLESNSVQGAIDYSNDTLVICSEAKSGSFTPTPEKLIVLCIETNHRIEINLKGWLKLYREIPYSTITSWDIRFINDFGKLMFIPANVPPTFAPFLDWVALKNKFINPSLERRRNLFRKRGY